MLGNPLLLGDDGYQISRSVRLRSSASAYFERTFGTPTSQNKWTISFWLKRGALGSDQAIFSSGSSGTDFAFPVRITSSNALTVVNYIGAYQVNLSTAALFRDPSAWYHIVVAFDTTNAVQASRVSVWVNGISQTLSGTYPALNDTSRWNTSGAVHRISRSVGGNTEYVDGYLTDINFIDGQALTPASFGETDAITGVWKPRRYTGTYGTNGFFLNFSDPSAATAAAIGMDYSGNGNNWTPNNISLTAGATYDSMLDVPTNWADGGNGRGNYATLNPLDVELTVASLSAGNLQHTGASGANRWSRSTVFVESGKFYWEVTTLTAVAQRNVQLRYGSTFSQYQSTGIIEINGVSVGSGYATWTTNDVIGVALDRDNNTVAFYKNGTLIYTGTSLSAGTVIPQFNSASTDVLAVNFGQRPFAYTPPTGFRALNTQNLPEPTIVRGNRFFDVDTYTGNGGTLARTGFAFAPDLIWNKPRSIANNNQLFDTVRGNTRILYSDLTNAENTVSGVLNSFDSNGYTLGSSVSVNQNAATYVSWLWREGATQGFDIVTWTGTGVGQTISHNLGVAPKLIIPKSRTGTAPTNSWHCYHASLGATRGILLNSTNAAATDSGFWNNTEPTSSVVTLGTYNSYSGQNYVAYLFSEVAGFSRFGSYTGNGSADGPFVFCGFRPRWVMIKASSIGGAGYDWWIWDTARSPSNVVRELLFPNASSAESVDNWVDITSNGFKLRNTYGAANASGQTYIFAAFSETAFKYSLAR